MRAPRFFCRQCGAEAAQWQGKCPACGEWNTLVESEISRGAPRLTSHSPAAPASMSAVASEVSTHARLATTVAEFDRVVGGGLVPGSVVLLAGDPGIGKSTLLLQVAHSFACAHGACCYLSGEESLSQVAMRGRRLGALCPDLSLIAATEVEVIEEQVTRARPQLLVVDSIQAVYCSDVEALPGSISQVRGSAVRLLRLAKELSLPTILVGHVTKEGAIAGPRVLEHMVDTVLSLEGEPHSGYRVLRATKNRFGATDEIGLFQMGEGGMEGVPDASAALLAERRAGLPGSSVVAALEGNRPLLVEIQALVSRSAAYATPRRSVTGLDYNRTCLVIAVLEKRVGLPLSSADVYVNVPGGVRVTEPGADLGVALAIASSFSETAISADTGCVGEVGLSGEVRAAAGLERRLAELARHGFARCLIPRERHGSGDSHEGMSLVRVETVGEALSRALGEGRAGASRRAGE